MSRNLVSERGDELRKRWENTRVGSEAVRQYGWKKKVFGLKSRCKLSTRRVYYSILNSVTLVLRIPLQNHKQL